MRLSVGIQSLHPRITSRLDFLPKELYLILTGLQPGVNKDIAWNRLNCLAVGGLNDLLGHDKPLKRFININYQFSPG